MVPQKLSKTSYTLIIFFHLFGVFIGIAAPAAQPPCNRSMMAINPEMALASYEMQISGIPFISSRAWVPLTSTFTTAEHNNITRRVSGQTPFVLGELALSDAHDLFMRTSKKTQLIADEASLKLFDTQSPIELFPDNSGEYLLVVNSGATRLIKISIENSRSKVIGFFNLPPSRGEEVRIDFKRVPDTDRGIVLISYSAGRTYLVVFNLKTGKIILSEMLQNLNIDKQKVKNAQSVFSSMALAKDGAILLSHQIIYKNPVQTQAQDSNVDHIELNPEGTRIKRKTKLAFKGIFGVLGQVINIPGPENTIEQLYMSHAYLGENRSYLIFQNSTLDIIGRIVAPNGYSFQNFLARYDGNGKVIFQIHPLESNPDKTPITRVLSLIDMHSAL